MDMHDGAIKFTFITLLWPLETSEPLNVWTAIQKQWTLGIHGDLNLIPRAP